MSIRPEIQVILDKWREYCDKTIAVDPDLKPLLDVMGGVLEERAEALSRGYIDFYCALNLDRIGRLNGIYYRPHGMPDEEFRQLIKNNLQRRNDELDCRNYAQTALEMMMGKERERG